MWHIPLLLTAIGDPDGTRTVTSIIVLLVALGLALLLLAVWVHRATRPDPDLLAPLEVMGDRSWRRGDPVWQRRRLDELRPPGAQPLAPSVAPPELDESFDAGPTASGFDDLHGETVAAEQPVAERPTGETVDHASPDRSSAEAASGPPDGAQLDQTPIGVAGPTLDEFPDGDFDPEAVAAAREQLERELAESVRDRPTQWQLDLFGRDPSA